MMSSVANVSAYPVMTHSRLDSDVSNSRRIVGIATFSTVLSRTTMNADTIVMASVTHRVGSVDTASASGASAKSGGSTELIERGAGS